MTDLKPTELVTLLLRQHIPANAVEIRTTDTHLEWLTPTKGWRKRSWRRIGIQPHTTNLNVKATA